MRSIPTDTNGPAMTRIKFNQYNVTNGTDKARCWYSLDGMNDGQPCVTIYAKEYGHELGRVFADVDGASYKNDTDTMTDYFDKGRVRLRPGHPLYAACRARAEANRAKWDAKIEAKRAKRAPVAVSPVLAAPAIVRPVPAPVVVAPLPSVEELAGMLASALLARVSLQARETLRGN